MFFSVQGSPDEYEETRPGENFQALGMVLFFENDSRDRRANRCVFLTVHRHKEVNIKYQ
jgi:hypothetical protein